MKRMFLVSVLSCILGVLMCSLPWGAEGVGEQLALLPQPGCHQDVLEHATVLLQTSLQVVGGSTLDEPGQHGHELLFVTSTNRSKLANNFILDAALRKGESFEKRVARVQNHSSQAHANSSIMLTSHTHRRMIADRTRFQELMHDIWLWTPMWLLAVAVSWYRPASKAYKYGSTSALSGLRACIALWITLEHAGCQPRIAPGSGTFIVLSGAAISTARRAVPGVTKVPFNTRRSYFNFIFLRMARILPLFWFFIGCLYPDPQCKTWGSTIGDCVLYFDEWGQGRNKPDDMVLFYSNMPGGLLNAFLNQPSRMLLLYIWPRHIWFLRTIMFMYIFYPVLEGLALGSWRKQPVPASHIRWALFMCCMAKFVEISAAILLVFHFGKTYEDVYWCPVLKIPDFMLGLLVPHLASPDSKGWIQWAPLVADILLVSFGLFVFFAPLEAGFGHGIFIYVCDKLTWLNIEASLTAFAIWGFCYGPTASPLGRLLSTKFFVKAGEWSYGVYLIHASMLTQYRLVRNVTPSWGFAGWTTEDWFMPFFVFLLFGKSWSLFVLIETPCSDIARWAITKRE